jgi:hypothetical protein
MDASDVLLDKIDSKVTQLKDWLGSGQAHEYSEYTKVCGEIRGLLFTKQEILDLKQKMENSDNE